MDVMLLKAEEGGPSFSSLVSRNSASRISLRISGFPRKE